MCAYVSNVLGHFNGTAMLLLLGKVPSTGTGVSYHFDQTLCQVHGECEADGCTRLRTAFQTKALHAVPRQICLRRSLISDIRALCYYYCLSTVILSF